MDVCKAVSLLTRLFNRQLGYPEHSLLSCFCVLLSRCGKKASMRSRFCDPCC